ncbi:MAG: hypothetical protein CMD78_04080 [Gammaproteobacteria bacterium]|nr:hypothetical protein [Gammaproteobacteria bacterium]|tara:strand:- start:3907 stop:5142 length:1236 start_codon:yes stop_codon:yes gene_type:complete
MKHSNIIEVTFLVFVILIVSISGIVSLTAQETQTRILEEQELVDMLVGSCIQSTRGCDPKESIKKIKEALNKGKQFKIISTDNFPDDWMVVAVQGIGGGGAWQHVIERTQRQNLPTITKAEANSRVADLLSEHMGKEVKALIRSEAAEATTTALLVAADKGIPTLDAGITGRAVPEVQQSIPWINGIASIPTAIITPWGDEVIIKHAIDEYRVEDISRAIAVASGGSATITMTPMSGKQLNQGAIPGNLSEAILFGKTVREATQAGKDPIEALIDASNGYKLFQGIVTKSDERGDRGFNWVDVEIRGTQEYAGHTYKVFVKNENIVSWLDDELDAISPDYIYNLNPETGESTTGGSGVGGYPLDVEVVMIGVPAPEQWRSKKGIELMGPKHFGFDFEYTPIEKLQMRRKTD